MRNLKKYPITSDEILELLDSHIQKENDYYSVVSIDAIFLSIIRSFLREKKAEFNLHVTRNKFGHGS